MTPLPFQPAAPVLARHVGTPLAAAAAEEVLDIRNIQGNILAGFNKDHQALLFLEITDAARAKRWLQFITPSIAYDGRSARLQSALQGLASAPASPAASSRRG